MSEETSTTEVVTSLPPMVDPAKPERGAEKPDFGKKFEKRFKKSATTLSSAKNAENELTGFSKKGKQIGTPKEDPETEAKVSLPPLNEAAKPKEEVKAAPPKEAPKPQEIKPEPRKHKVRINGEEREISEEQLIRDYQIRQASDEKFRAAAELDKRNQALLAKAKSKEGIQEFLQAFGHDPRALAEEYLADVLNFEMLSPEQKRIKQLEYENSRLSQAEKMKAEEQSRIEEQKVVAHHRDRIQKSIIQTLQGSDLPNTPETVRKFARHMKALIEGGIPAEPSDVVDLVREEIANENKSILSKMTPEQLIQYLGKEKLDEYRQWELSKIKNPVVATKETNQPVRRSENQKRHYKTMEDFKKSQLRDGVVKR